MNKDQVKGRLKEASGKVEQVAGRVVGNRKLEAKGLVKKIAGSLQAGYGDAKSELQKKDSPHFDRT